jgi:hypothetical protein
VAEQELKIAYKKTQQTILNDARLSVFFSDVHRSRIFDWDEFVRGYLHGRSEIVESVDEEDVCGKRLRQRRV